MKIKYMPLVILYMFIFGTFLCNIYNNSILTLIISITSGLTGGYIVNEW